MALKPFLLVGDPGVVFESSANLKSSCRDSLEYVPPPSSLASVFYQYMVAASVLQMCRWRWPSFVNVSASSWLSLGDSPRAWVTAAVASKPQASPFDWDFKEVSVKDENAQMVLLMHMQSIFRAIQRNRLNVMYGSPTCKIYRLDQVAFLSFEWCPGHKWSQRNARKLDCGRLTRASSTHETFWGSILPDRQK